MPPLTNACAVLPDRVGMSRRMIVYYESQGGVPPAPVIVGLAKALQVSADHLLGLNVATCGLSSPKDAKLRRRLLDAESLPDRDRRTVADMIDALKARQTLISE